MHVMLKIFTINIANIKITPAANVLQQKRHNCKLQEPLKRVFH